MNSSTGRLTRRRAIGEPITEPYPKLSFDLFPEGPDALPEELEANKAVTNFFLLIDPMINQIKPKISQEEVHEQLFKVLGEIKRYNFERLHRAKKITKHVKTFEKDLRNESNRFHKNFQKLLALLRKLVSQRLPDRGPEVEEIINLSDDDDVPAANGAQNGDQPNGSAKDSGIVLSANGSSTVRSEDFKEEVKEELTQEVEMNDSSEAEAVSQVQESFHEAKEEMPKEDNTPVADASQEEEAMEVDGLEAEDMKEEDEEVAKDDISTIHVELNVDDTENIDTEDFENSIEDMQELLPKLQGSSKVQTDYNTEISEETKNAISWFKEVIKEAALVSNVSSYSKLHDVFEAILQELFHRSPKYLKSNHFRKFINDSTYSIFSIDSDVFGPVLEIFKDVAEELGRLTIDFETEDDSGDDDKDQKKGAKGKKRKRKRISVKDMSRPDKEKNLKKLDKFIAETEAQIHKYENEELDENALDGPSYFSLLPCFRSKLVKAWKLRQKIAGRSSSSMSAFSKPFRYRGTDNTKFNDLISNYYQAMLNKVDRKYSGRQSTLDAGNFFTLEELEAFVEEKLPKISMEKKIIDVYTDLLEENKKRFKDQHSFEYYQNRGSDDLKDEDDSADQKLEEKLKENDRKSKETVQKLKADVDRMKKEAEDFGDPARNMIDVDNDRDGEDEEETGSDDEEEFDLEKL